MSKKRKSYKSVSEREFKSIKGLQDAGVAKNTAAKATGRSWETISIMYKSDSFDDYKETVRKRGEHYKQAREQQEVKQEEQPALQPVVTTNELADAVNRVADTLERLVKAWEKPNKRKFL